MDNVCITTGVEAYDVQGTTGQVRFLTWGASTTACCIQAVGAPERNHWAALQSGLAGQAARCGDRKCRCRRIACQRVILSVLSNLPDGLRATETRQPSKADARRKVQTHLPSAPGDGPEPGASQPRKARRRRWSWPRPEPGT